ncbi:hypothetical protein Q5H93_06215 [Hymenobacter sp. ASUV-10]|uniref:DUF3168 domain-containing protein n=1 Tax=Hymenobacter aranciens TaxID=3063996 RepID=A0ABT9B7R6_9BACT|nr:hypothetical protein [Hymenobacter sp. ASUV-10]MDO7874320.1 hypothetical protein [Hymenobacter sp. ASUV-10]
MATTSRPLPKDQPKDIRGLYDALKQIAAQHVAFADFGCGESVNYTSSTRNYPLLYLELPFSISVAGDQGKGYLETYDVTVAVADRTPSDTTELDLINALSRVKQLLVHVHTLLDAQVKCSPLSILTYQEAGSDRMVVARGQFTATMYRADAPQDAAKSATLA